MTTSLITGASRGIGLEHVRQALAAGETVIAACRTPTDGDPLDQLRGEFAGERLRIERLDIADPASIDALADRLRGTPIDILVNNAGLYGPPGASAWPEGAALQTLAGMDYDLWDTILKTNVVGPFRLTAALLGNVMASERKLVVMMSSDLGSITNNHQGFSHAYRSSKAALNMLTRGLAVDLRPDGVTVVSLAPGWTQTDLGGGDATWTVHDSVANQRKLIATLDLEHSGRFVNLTGEEIAW